MVLFIYGHQTRFVIDRNSRQNIFLGQDYGMLYTANKTKQNFLDYSFHLSDASAIPKYPKEKLLQTTKKTKTVTAVLLIKYKSRHAAKP